MMREIFCGLRNETLARLDDQAVVNIGGHDAFTTDFLRRETVVLSGATSDRWPCTAP